jgi:pilus assembly protein Flp/PilA
MTRTDCASALTSNSAALPRVRLDPDRPIRHGRRRTKEPVMQNLFTRFAKNESGATAIEYGLIAALISVACITIMGTLGTNLKNTFTNVANKL